MELDITPHLTLREKLERQTWRVQCALLGHIARLGTTSEDISHVEHEKASDRSE